MRAVFLSNINCDPIRNLFADWDLRTGTYNDALLQLAKPDSMAAHADTEVVICHLDGDELWNSGDPCFSSSATKGNDPDALGDTYLNAIDRFCRSFPTTTLLTNTLVVASSPVSSYADQFAKDGTLAFEQHYRHALLALAKQHANLGILPLHALYREFGRKTLHTNTYWYLGRIKYSNEMFRQLAFHYKNLFEAFNQRSKKVLVVDLDNTLWGGVIGEVGVSGISLSLEGIGRAFHEFQAQLKRLKNQGVLLAIASKNNPADVEPVFAHPAMLLRPDDFVSTKIGWNPKHQSILEIAEELSLGTDSFVFVDDSAVERALVSKVFPEVFVPDFPDAPESLSEWFLNAVVYPHFPRYRTSSADTLKTAQYQARSARESLRDSLSLEQFISELEIKVEVFDATIADLDRAAQLTQKTNQFNVTTRRYSLADMKERIQSVDYGVFLARYRDRFGDEGITGLAILELQHARLDTLLLSCRVIGRNVESHLLRFAETRLRQRGSATIFAEFIETKRNLPAKDVFERHEYRLVERDSAAGRTAFEKDLL